MVLPTTAAPARSRRSTASAWAVAGRCARAKSGLPAPVISPARSKLSFTATCRPFSGPMPSGGTSSRGPGRKAPRGSRSDGERLSLVIRSGYLQWPTLHRQGPRGQAQGQVAGNPEGKDPEVKDPEGKGPSGG